MTPVERYLAATDALAAANTAAFEARRELERWVDEQVGKTTPTEIYVHHLASQRMVRFTRVSKSVGNLNIAYTYTLDGVHPAIADR